MRKITQEIALCFKNGTPYRKDNTEVRVSDGIVEVFLHGNLIAKRIIGNYIVDLFDGFHRTATTKERLNGILKIYGHSKLISQKKGVWYFGEEKIPSCGVVSLLI